ncbi:centromere protein k-like [Plakobranchus ocellatus]|uniref:Centromere protein k-like n=1 Tax=Plakobranchus ocellatus TaxID=259542 RepID=A0AAV4DAV4_9GAST|nr:centromere protein k-like [Plakobranchus ocellatus]
MDAEEVAKQCSQDWHQVKNIQTELQSSMAMPISSDDPLLHILQETEKRLKGELQGIKERELSAIPQNNEMQVLILQQEEQKALEEYREALAFLRAKRADIAEALEKSEAEFSQLKQMNVELKKKVNSLQQTEQEKSNSNSLEVVLSEMQAKVTRVGEADRYFKRALKNILATRCPTPDAAQVRRTLNESQDIDPNQVMDTKRMLGKLIEQTLNSPEQPYIELDNRAWPAQVEFLLRCQVAVQHPEDPKKIKLMPFHL